MRILIDMGHPAHVHLFKNFIWEMEKRGHEFKITARDKDVTQQLLKAYNIPYELVGKRLSGGLSLIREWILRSYNVAKIGKKFNADIYIGVLNPSTAFSAWINRKQSLTFTDTEHATFAKLVTFPFSTYILTPSCYIGKIGKKQIRYDGYHELAYLHPKYFTPNPSILDEIGLTEKDPYIIMRFVSWKASHDIGQQGIQDKISFVKTLEQYGRIFITSEGDLPSELRSYQLVISPEKLHDLLYYSTMYIGEGGTVATEAAVLGIPSIYISSLVGTMGNFIELERKYHLINNFRDENEAISSAISLLSTLNIKEEWASRLKNLLNDKIDVTAFMLWFVENYPRSDEEMRKNPEIQCSFALGLTDV